MLFVRLFETLLNHLNDRFLSMEETPTVSVVAVCYNHSRFVREALDSIKRQAWPKLQLIFCDDASQDSSVEAHTLGRPSGHVF